jgi:hypothetical protein
MPGVIPAVALLFLAAAQTAPSNPVNKPPDSSAPVLNVTTRLVYVDVVVRDGAGQLIRNLTQQDFKIEEDGRPQKVDFFAAHGQDQTGATTATPLPSQPDEFSNVPEQKNSGAVNMVLFDLVNRGRDCNRPEGLPPLTVQPAEDAGC